MGGLGEIFGFDGRVNRLGYLWRTLVAGVVIAVVAGVGAAGIVVFARPDGVESLQGWLQYDLVAVMLLSLWSGFALTARRLRDMGLEPAHIVPLYAALWVANAVLLQPMSQLDPDRYGLAEQVWTAAQVFSVLPLLFWPGRDKASPMLAQAEASLGAAPVSTLNWRESG